MSEEFAEAADDLVPCFAETHFPGLTGGCSQEPSWREEFLRASPEAPTEKELNLTTPTSKKKSPGLRSWMQPQLDPGKAPSKSATASEPSQITNASSAKSGKKVHPKPTAKRKRKRRKSEVILSNHLPAIDPQLLEDTVNPPAEDIAAIVDIGTFGDDADMFKPKPSAFTENKLQRRAPCFGIAPSRKARRRGKKRRTSCFGLTTGSDRNKRRKPNMGMFAVPKCRFSLKPVPKPEQENATMVSPKPNAETEIDEIMDDIDDSIGNDFGMPATTPTKGDTIASTVAAEKSDEASSASVHWTKTAFKSLESPEALRPHDEDFRLSATKHRRAALKRGGALTRVIETVVRMEAAQTSIAKMNHHGVVSTAGRSKMLLRVMKLREESGLGEDFITTECVRQSPTGLGIVMFSKSKFQKLGVKLGDHIELSNPGSFTTQHCERDVLFGFHFNLVTPDTPLPELIQPSFEQDVPTRIARLTLKHTERMVLPQTNNECQTQLRNVKPWSSYSVLKMARLDRRPGLSVPGLMTSIRDKPKDAFRVVRGKARRHPGIRAW